MQYFTVADQLLIFSRKTQLHGDGYKRKLIYCSEKFLFHYNIRVFRDETCIVNNWLRHVICTFAPFTKISVCRFISKVALWGYWGSPAAAQTRCLIYPPDPNDAV